MPATLITPPATTAATAARITVKVGATTITQRFGVDFDIVGSGIGSGTFSLLNDNAQNSLLDYGTLVTFELDGDVFARWFINSIEQVQVDAAGEAEKVTTYSGPSNESMTEDSTVYPATGIVAVPSGVLAGLRLGTQPFGDRREFGYPDPTYTRTGWGAATQVGDMSGVDRPVGMPDKGTKLLWTGAVDGSGNHALGSAVFHTTFTVASGVMAVKLFAAARETIDGIWIDGVNVLSTDSLTARDVFKVARSSTWKCTDYITHHIVAKVTHDATGPAGFAATLYEAGTDNVIVRTTTAWTCVDAASIPALTWGYVIGKAITEAQARGDLAGLTTTFTATTDSAGDTWPAIEGEFGVTAGDEVFSLLEQAGQLGVEWGMDPADAANTLSMWVARSGVDYGRGVDTAVEFAEGVNCTRLVHSVRG